jgi:hypothetical protein
MKKFTIFALIGFASTAFSLNAMNITYENPMNKRAITIEIEEKGIFSQGARVSEELYSLIQLSKLQHPSNENQNELEKLITNIKNSENLKSGNLKQELMQYKDTLEKRRASLPHQLECFILGSQHLLTATFLAYCTYNKVWEDKNCKKPSREQLFMSIFAVTTFLYGGYKKCKESLTWQSIMTKKINTAKKAQAVLEAQ